MHMPRFLCGRIATRIALGLSVAIVAAWLDSRKQSVAASPNVLPTTVVQGTTSSKINGFIDIIRDGVLRGWVADISMPRKPVQVEIWARRYYQNEKPVIIGTLKPSLMRPDVNASLGINGVFGFAFRIPEAYRNGSIYYLYATGRNSSSETPLKGSPVVFAFGQSVEVGGVEQVIFNHSIAACEQADIPDAPAHAFRDNTGKIQLLAAHYVTYRLIGADFNHLKKDCNQPVMRSLKDPDPSKFSDFQWPVSLYTLDGKTIYTIVHDEYHPWEHKKPPFDNASWCGVKGPDVLAKCWYNALTYAVSKDGGRSYVQPDLPSRFLAGVPYKYEPRMGKTGLFAPSNIVHNVRDGYYYALAYRTVSNAAGGSCVFRTKNLSDPKSWRAWGGAAFDVKFYDPYRDRITDPDKMICTVLPDVGMPRSITFNTFLNKWLVVSDGTRKVAGRAVHGFFYALSDDLIHWTEPRLIVEVRSSWSDQALQGGPILAYPSLIDENDQSKNFENSGQTAYLYYTRWEPGSNWTRNLVRVPIQFLPNN